MATQPSMTKLSSSALEMAVPNANNLDPQLIISKLLAELGEPWLPVHRQALEAVAASNAETLRILSATNLDDSFCRACGYMASIPKMPPTIAILIAESAWAIADAQRERTIHSLNTVIVKLIVR
jgi:hypothetical protein